MNEHSADHHDKHPKLAAIDIGTNSIRLIVVEVLPDGRYRLIDDEKAVCRLGRGMSADDCLTQEAMAESAMAIARMSRIAEGYNVAALRAVGTCAVREARNSDAFQAMVKQEAGIDVDVISAEEEARLAHMSVVHAFDLEQRTVAVADIGGGSTEIILGSGDVIEQIYATNLGAVRLTERFNGLAPGDGESFKAMRAHIRKTLRRRVGVIPFRPQMLIGAGGTFTALAGISRHHASTHATNDLLPFSVRGYEMHRSEVRHLLERLFVMPLRLRTRIPGLSTDRAELIVAGGAVVDGIMKHFHIDTLCIHDRGIRDGLILTMIRDLFPARQRVLREPGSRMNSVRELARSCEYESRHSEHVAALALSLFDQMTTAEPLMARYIEPPYRELLEAAAVLHDIGYYINYSKHHKHAYHLITHSDLHGFSQREVEIIANVARYHRRATPKLKHEGYARLSDEDRATVRTLSAILRVADGLDRTHVQNVKSLRYVPDNGLATIHLHADEDPATEIWGAERKSQLFRKVFRKELEFLPHPPDDGHHGDESADMEVQTQHNGLIDTTPPLRDDWNPG